MKQGNFFNAIGYLCDLYVNGKTIVDACKCIFSLLVFQFGSKKENNSQDSQTTEVARTPTLTVPPSTLSVPHLAQLNLVSFVTRATVSKGLPPFLMTLQLTMRRLTTKMMRMMKR